ncbi:MAG: ADP-heptose synthase, partial [Rhodospirillaceae bacterium]|nr:ADP-heptose synthase [Rhodospirillaceae bacterium]
MKTVFVSGRFNVLHPGHIRLFKFAKECGDKLIVAVESDELSAEGAHVPEKMRLEGVLCNEYVDEAFVINQAGAEALAEEEEETQAGAEALAKEEEETQAG